jgi:hypothetical protein
MSTISDPFGFRARHQNAKPRRSQKGVATSTTPTPLLVSQPPPPPSSQSAPARTPPEACPRRPKAGCQIAHNTLRPRVAAADRLLCWDSPWSLAHREALTTALPPTLVNSALAAVRSALAPATKSSYGGGILRFSQFCDEHGIREEERMPASYALLSAFIGTYKGRVSGSTVKGWMSGLRAWHLVNHAPWHGDDDWVKLARSAANKEGAVHKRAPRSPISTEHLCVLKVRPPTRQPPTSLPDDSTHQAHLELSNPFHAAVWAVATATFFGCRRLGETTVLSKTAFSPSQHVLRSTTYVLATTYPISTNNHPPLSLASLSESRPRAASRYRSESPGRRRPPMTVPPSSSPPAMTPSAPATLYATTSTSTAPFPHRPPSSRSKKVAAGR